MKVLVTGGAGFVGAHVAKALIDRGDEVIIVDNLNDYYDPSLKRKRLTELLTPESYTFYEQDITNYDAMNAIFEKHDIDVVCHLAAQAGVRHSLSHPLVYAQVNEVGTLIMLELTRQHNISQFVFASSSSVYGGNEKMPFSEEDAVEKPLSLYAATKRSNELTAYTYSQLYGIKCTGLRFFTVYGPWGRPDMALFAFAEAIEKGDGVCLHNNGDMERDFTFVTDIVSGVIAAIDNPFPYEIFNLGGGHPVQLKKYLSLLEQYLGKEAKTKGIPMQPGEVKITRSDISKAKKMLGYEPRVSVEEGVKQFVEWYSSKEN